MQKIRNKGMLSLEYAVFIVILIAALIGMSLYIRRAICAKFRESGDTFGYGRQYQP